MKRTYQIIIFLFVITTSIFSQDFWIRQQSPTTKWLYRCVFSDSANGWAVGDSGIVIHTTNAGATWEIQQTGLDAFIYDVYFLNKNYGWAVADGYPYMESIILKTNDGGKHWTYSFYPDSTVIINTVYYLDTSVGFLAGYQGLILRTSNGGNSWARMEVDSGFYYRFHIQKLVFYNNQIGFATGGIMDFGGVIWRTTNGGFNWHSYSVAPEPVYNVHIINPDNAIGCGGDFEFSSFVIKSSNTGTIWEYQPLQIYGIGQCVSFRTPYDIWVPLGFSQRWAHSIDSGHTWTEIFGNDSSSVYASQFLDSLHGWAFGANGSILKYNALIGIKPVSENIPNKFELFQNYPNPFNPSTKIKFSIPSITPPFTKGGQGGLTSLKIYDILGREVATLVNESLQPGTYEVEWNACNFASGIYFYKFTSGEFVQTRKMILVK